MRSRQSTLTQSAVIFVEAESSTVEHLCSFPLYMISDVDIHTSAAYFFSAPSLGQALVAGKNHLINRMFCNTIFIRNNY